MWQTPKTDWYSETLNGEYIGDRFNVADYNRIKNNIVYLQQVVNDILSQTDFEALGEDKTRFEYFYASEINKMENNLEKITSKAGVYAGSKQTFYDNGTIFDSNELNRIEKASLDVYNKLNERFIARRKFTFKLGDVGGF